MSITQQVPSRSGMIEVTVVPGGTNPTPEPDITGKEVEVTRRALPARPRKRYELPPEVIPAAIGGRGVFWKLLKPLYVRTGWKSLIVGPSLREQIERAKVKLYSHCENNGYTVTVVPSKGGVGKTHTIALLSTLFAWITDQAIGAIDVNPSEGNLHTRLGIDKTVNLLALLRAYNTQQALRIRNHSLMIHDVGKHPADGLHNVHVIRFDDGQSKVKPLEPDRKVVKNLLLACRQSFHTGLYDTGNSLYSPWTLGAAEISNVILISFVPWMENAEGGAKSSLERLIELSPEIAARILIVVNGEKRKITDKVTADYANRFGHPVKNVIVLPYDRIFEPLSVRETGDGASEQPVRVVDPRKARPGTVLTALHFAIRIAEVAEENGSTELTIAEPTTEEECEELK